jgi:hypothetical protein
MKRPGPTRWGHDADDDLDTAPLRRDAFSGAQETENPAFLPKFLHVSAADLNALAMSLGRLAGQLPVRALSAVERTRLGRRSLLTYAGLVQAVGRGLSACPEVAAAAGTPPSHLRDLHDKGFAYLRFRRLGARLTNLALDMRLAHGNLMLFTVKLVLDALNNKLADPALPRAKSESLLNDFGPALVSLDQIMRTQAEQRKMRAKSRAQAPADAEEADSDEGLLHLVDALKQHRPASGPVAAADPPRAPTTTPGRPGMIR